jgi:exosortase/archaeosortase family protein
LNTLLTATSLRLLAWAALTGLGAAVLYRPSVEALAQVMRQPMTVVDQHMVHTWGVLTLCAGGVWLKRASIRVALGRGSSAWSVALGAVWIGASFWLFPPAALLAGTVGAFALLVGRAALWPSALLGIYLLSSAFPIAIERWADTLVGAVTASAAASVVGAAGYPLVITGNFIAFADSAGHVIRVLINSSCAGPATMGVFLAIYALMAIDSPLAWRPAAALFTLGFIGTWLQNVARLVYLLLVGHHQGEAAMWAAHNDSGYLWFIAWYAVFGVLYLRVATGGRGGRGPGDPVTMEARAPLVGREVLA